LLGAPYPVLVGRQWTFEAAHNLLSYQGGPEPLHGHSYRLEVTLDCPVGEDGLAFDFVELDRIVRERVLAKLHDAYINDVVDPSTTECIAIWIWGRLQGLPLYEVKVWEGPNGFAAHRG
jgi:6-pyruvoyltetrahydropterin/6-carboxytetrahydropterin synthase